MLECWTTLTFWSADEVKDCPADNSPSPAPKSSVLLRTGGARVTNIAPFHLVSRPVNFSPTWPPNGSKITSKLRQSNISTVLIFHIMFVVTQRNGSLNYIFVFLNIIIRKSVWRNAQRLMVILKFDMKLGSETKCSIKWSKKITKKETREGQKFIHWGSAAHRGTSYISKQITQKTSSC